MSPPEEEYLDWVPKRRIPLPPQAADEYMLIRIHDFQRLRKRIDEELSSSRHENIPAAYFALFGAAIATGAAVPPLLTAKDLPSWIVSTFVVLTGAFLALGLILVFLARTLQNGREKSASEISQEMRDLEETYHGTKFRDDSRGFGNGAGDRSKQAAKSASNRLITGN